MPPAQGVARVAARAGGAVRIAHAQHREEGAALERNLYFNAMGTPVDFQGLTLQAR